MDADNVKKEKLRKWNFKKVLPLVEASGRVPIKIPKDEEQRYDLEPQIVMGSQTIRNFLKWAQVASKLQRLSETHP